MQRSTIGTLHIVYRLCSETGTLADATGAQGGTTGLSRMQGSTTGTLAAATGAQRRTTGLSKVQGSTTGSLATATAAQEGALETRAGATRQ